MALAVDCGAVEASHQVVTIVDIFVIKENLSIDLESLINALSP